MSSEYRGIEVFGRAARRRAEPERRVRRARLGLVALLAGGATVVATSAGIAASLAGHFATGILLAYLATGTSVVAVLCGAASVVTGRGRRWGAVAIALGILASPPVLTRLLHWASGLG